MSEAGSGQGGAGRLDGDGGGSHPTLSVNAQFVKDLSFENPNAPRSLVAGQEPPKVDVSVDLNAETVDEENGLYEVALSLRAKATLPELDEQGNEQLVFLAELTYGGVFTIRNLPPEHLEPFLMIECPRYLFPFARAIIADTTRDGGFPPLMINPIDFAGMYERQRSSESTNER